MPVKKLFLSVLLSVLLIPSAFAAIVSVDNTFVAGDSHSSDFHTRLNRDIVQLENGINNIVTTQITDDTLLEADFADEINPRIRTYQGAACEFVYTGLLPVTSGTLTTDTAAGTAYPRGYYCNKSSTTSHSYTASKWTYLDIDQNCNFQYSETTIDAATPAVATNSIRLARVSTDTTTVLTVVDLATRSCTTGNFDDLSSAASEATLGDVLKNGAPVRRFSPAGRTPQGHAQGVFVSYDTHTTFKVTAGSAYINGKYRAASTDTTVTTGADAPATGGSGLDTGAIAASTRYYVYLAADQDAVKTYSVSFSTSASSPTGVTNSRLIGSILTDASTLFTSRDTATVHGVSERELPGGWIYFTSGGVINNSFNVSSLTDSAGGDWTINWDIDYNNANYVASGNFVNAAAITNYVLYVKALTAGTTRMFLTDAAQGGQDADGVVVVSIGDKRV